MTITQLAAVRKPAENAAAQRATAEPTKLATIPELIADMAAGKMVILVDDEDRENEGDIVLAADHVTPEAINFMARFCRGLICLTLTRERCERLNLPPMVVRNGTKHGTAFTVSIEAATGVTTGISAADRARTVQAAVAPNATAAQLVQPGHIFPLQAVDGGVLMRAGHTEAGCDLASMAGCSPAAVICEIMNDDGTMARLPDLIEFGKAHGLKVGSIAELIRYRAQSESIVTQVLARKQTTRYGEFDAKVFKDRFGGIHLALSVGEWKPETPVLVRVHEPRSILDWLESLTPDQHSPVSKVLQRLQADGAGVFVMLHANDAGERLLTDLDPNATPDKASSSEAALRVYGVGAQILKQLGVRKMRVIGSERKMPSMSGFDLEAVEFLRLG